MYGPDPVGFVKQPTYLGTTGHVRVGYAERAPPPQVIMYDLPMFGLSLPKDLRGGGVIL